MIDRLLPWVLSRVTGTFKKNVYLRAAGRSKGFEDLQSSRPLQHMMIMTLGLDGQERPSTVHLPAPARGA